MRSIRIVKTNPTIDGMATDICVALGRADQEAAPCRELAEIDLAEQSGVHEVHISDLERGTREPGLRTLSKIALALETTLVGDVEGIVMRARI